MARPAALTRTEIVLVAAGGLGAVTLLLSGFVAGGDDRWAWTSAPLFVYGTLVALAAAPVAVLLGRRSAQTHLALGAAAVVNGTAVLLAGGGARSAAVLVLACAALVFAGGLGLHRGARPPTE